ncbi:MAG TPA: signal recognition particle-docking protein FtsY [Gammaproteobacteria bacterium]|jgi:fused signal recognition particle receptor|nr:signal recognition particle-docking protein FtsY [Gammaproteobacteria bacterium]
MTQTTPASSLFGRLRNGLRRAALHLTPGSRVDETVLEELETQLLMADVGIDACRDLLARLRTRIKSGGLADTDALRKALRDDIHGLLEPVARPLELTGAAHPFVILVVGVNGAGKTTTIGKLAQRLHAENRTVILAAGDTFRAAAIEQLQTWGTRHGVAVIAQGNGADPAAVAHDAHIAARSRGCDVLIVDTAGRLHTQGGLMEELKKIRRVLSRLDDTAPQECLLVIDAGTGQNALKQIEQFNAAVNVTGLVITKLDGTAKGGIVIAAAKRFGIPIRFIGVGEQADDLQPFDADAFAAALVGQEIAP